MAHQQHGRLRLTDHGGGAGHTFCIDGWLHGRRQI
jgi:hypothetical protein